MKLSRLASLHATAGLLVVSVTAVAQPLPEAELDLGREVVVTGAPGERPVVVYGAANVGVQLVFDAPLQRTDAGTTLRVPGGDVRLHPYLENSLFVTPSRALTKRPAVPLHVALADGGVPLVLVFRPGTVDHVLRILRRPPAPDAGTAVSGATLEEMLSGVASAVLGEGGCASLQSRRVQPERVKQLRHLRGVLVCAAGSFNYLRVQRKRPGCTVSSARLLREGKDVEVALVEPAQSGEKSVAWQVLAAWSPAEKTLVELLLLAADGTVCERVPDVTLKPGVSP